MSAVNLYDVEKVILLGDVSDRPQALIDRLNRLIGPRIIMQPAGERTVVSSRTESFVRTGAIACLHRFFQG